jgi:hypothetical protein
MYQRESRAKSRQRQLELAARRLLTLMKREYREKARQIAEERRQPLSTVVAVLATLALRGLGGEERRVGFSGPRDAS